MGNFTCGNDAAMGRSVMGCHNQGVDLMGWGVPKWIKKTGSFLVESGEQTLDVLGVKKSGETKRADRLNIIKNDTNRMNAYMATINSGTSNYKSITKSISSLDSLWIAVYTNKGGVANEFPRAVWDPRIGAAWVETGHVYKRNADIILSHYRQGLSADTADQASAAANGLLNEYTALKILAFNVTKAQPGYTGSQKLVDNLVAQLRAVAKKLRAAGMATAAQAELTTAKAFTDIGERQKALGEGKFPIVPIAIAGAAAIGAFLIFKG